MRPIARPQTSPWQNACGRALGALALLALAACGSGNSTGPRTDPMDSTDWNQALNSAQEQMLADPVQPYWPFRMAEIYVALDSLELAQGSLGQTLALAPDHAPALLLRSKILYKQARHEEAVKLLESALQRGSQHADELRIALALNLGALGATEEAEAVLAQCHDDPRLQTGTASFLSLRGDHFLQSRPVTEGALQTDPASASNHNNFGISLLYEGDPEGAHAAFLTALELDPRLAGALYNLAIVETYYFYDLDKGREWFTRYAELESEDPDDLQSVFGVDLAAGGHRSGVPWAESERSGRSHDAK